MTDPRADPVLMQFRSALDQLFGTRIDRVLLFGSRARGDAHPDSDYDVAVFLKSLDDRWGEYNRLADLRSQFLDDTGAFIDAKPFRASALEDRTPLMHEVRLDGSTFDAGGRALCPKGQGNAGAP
jgi:predicted nucleotidyltransferase